MNQDMNRIDNENSFLSGPCFIDVEVAIGLHRIQKNLAKTLQTWRVQCSVDYQSIYLFLPLSPSL